MRVVRIPTVRSKHFETVLHSFLCTLHAVTARYDIVHFHALGPTLFVPIIRLSGGIAVASIQGLDWQRAKWGLIATAVLRICERTAIWFPQATIVVSRALEQYFRRVYGAATHYIPNGVYPCVARRPIAIRRWGLESQKYVLFVGRLSPEKNCHLLIEAFSSIDRDVKLVFAGDGPAQDRYVERLKASASDRIHFLGYVAGEALQELLSNAAIFVLPSSIEGLSIALLEAMSYGNCVVTSDIQENKELVDGRGFTFANGNAPDLTRLLNSLLGDPRTRAATGARAKAWVHQEFSWVDVAARTERLYQSLCTLDR